MRGRFFTALALVGVLVLLIGGLPGALAETSPSAKRPYVVVLEPSLRSSASIGTEARSLGITPSLVFSHAIEGYAASLSADDVRSLESDPRVAFVQPDILFQAASLSPVCQKPWLGGTPQCVPTGVSRIGGKTSSAQSGDGVGSTDVDVAVIDSGIDTTHPDLDVAGGVACRVDSPDFEDLNGHGTHVAGTIGAFDNGIGVVGVAPGARLWAVRVLDDRGWGYLSSVICGIDWVTATRTDADPTNDISVANMSLGGPGTDDGDCGRTAHDALHRAICRSTHHGVTYVASAGNDGVNVAGAVPAAYDEVLTVTAVGDYDGLPGALSTRTCRVNRPNTDDELLPWSNYATRPQDRSHTIAAPGACIRSTLPPSPNGSYAQWSGTSMASPHVAGVIALCIASGACDGLSPAGNIWRIRRDAALHASDVGRAEGFQGDPDHRVPGRYVGYLVYPGWY